MKYLIENIGCDDTTYTEIELNEDELQTIIRFAKENNKTATYQCKPSIEIYKKFTTVTTDSGFTYYEYDDKDNLLLEEN